VIAIIGAICVVLAGNNGFSWTLVIMGIVVVVYNFLMSKTTLGRHIYGVGGNPEAAELSGIGVAKITTIVFTSMGALTAISGVIYASRMQSALPQEELVLNCKQSLRPLSGELLQEGVSVK